MRRTGKLYGLTLASAAAATTATISICFWNNRSHTLHLWLDIVPQGFGMASLITSTLIVRFSIFHTLILAINTDSQAMIASVTKEDLAVATGGKSANV